MKPKPPRPSKPRKPSARLWGRFARINDTTWPVPATDTDDGDTEWRLRYSTPTREDLLFAASVMAAYGSMIYSTQRKRNYISSVIQDLQKAPLRKAAK